MSNINPHEFVWLQSKVYVLELKLQKIAKLLLECEKSGQSMVQLQHRISRILQGLPEEE